MPVLASVRVLMQSMKSALTFELTTRCSTTKARISVLTLPHGPVNTPVFMPVGTQGTLKGLTPKQLEDLGCQIMLNNTYHLVGFARNPSAKNFFFKLTQTLLSYILGLEA